MSTSWDLYCLDCETEANSSADHSPIRQYELLPLLELAKVITPEVASTVKDCGMHETAHGIRPPIDWLSEHGKHRLRMRSEYGEIEGQCCKRVTCAHCGCEPGYCDLDAEHGGSCSTERQRTAARGKP